MRDWCGAEVGYRPLSCENEIPEPKPVKLTRKKLSVYLSFDNFNEAAKILEGFGIKQVKDNNDEKEFLAPTWRPDISIEEDLIEEVGRFKGYNDSEGKLPGELPRRASIGEEMQLAGFIRQFLMARGYTEVMTYSFLSEDFPQKLRLDENDLRADPVKIANPISRDQMAMRTTLIPGLLAGLKTSIASGWRNPVKIFEQGKIFLKDSKLEHIELDNVAGLVFNGTDTRSPFNDRDENFYNVKSDVNALIKSRGYEPEFLPGKENFAHAGQTAEIRVNNKKIGFIARLKPAIEQELDVSGVYIFEFNVAELMQIKKPVFKPVSQFPASLRDISMLVSVDRKQDDVIKDIRNSVIEAAQNNNILESVRLFDIYEGKGVPEGFRSLAYALNYRSRETTLKDEEVEKIHTQVRENLKLKGYIMR